MNLGARIAAWSGGKLSAKSYVQDGLIAMWDGIENAGWGSHNKDSTQWIDLIGTNNLDVLDGGVWDYNALYGNGKYPSASNTNVITASHIECCFLVPNALTNRSWVISTGQSYNNQYSGFVGRYDRQLCFGRMDTYTVFPTSRASVSFGVNDSEKSFLNGVKQTVIGYTDLTPLTGRGIFMLVGGMLNKAIESYVYSIRLYNRELEDTEIAHNYAIDKARFGLT